MFKKLLVTATMLTISASSSLCAVPIFGSTDSAQQIELTPASNLVTPGTSVDNNIKVQNDYAKYGQIRDDNFKNAIQSLDSAQVGIREQLVDYKLKYSDAKIRYDASKAECSVLKKQIKAHEKQMKEIDRAKSKIAKNISN